MSSPRRSRRNPSLEGGRGRGGGERRRDRPDTDAVHCLNDLSPYNVHVVTSYGMLRGGRALRGFLFFFFSFLLWRDARRICTIEFLGKRRFEINKEFRNRAHARTASLGGGDVYSVVGKPEQDALLSLMRSRSCFVVCGSLQVRVCLQTPAKRTENKRKKGTKERKGKKNQKTSAETYV